MVKETARHLAEEIRMASDKKLFTLRPDTSTGQHGDMVMTHGADDLAERKAAADQAGRDYTVSDVPK